MQETWVQSLGWEDRLEREMATHSSILAWTIPWTEKPGRLQSIGSQRVKHNWSDLAYMHKIEIKTVTATADIPFKIQKPENWLDHGGVFYLCEIEISAHVVNPRDGGAWWAAIYGITQSQAQLKWLSSSSSSSEQTYHYFASHINREDSAWYSGLHKLWSYEVTWEHKSQWSMTFSLWFPIRREETQNGKGGGIAGGLKTSGLLLPTLDWKFWFEPKSKWDIWLLPLNLRTLALTEELTWIVCTWWPEEKDQRLVGAEVERAGYAHLRRWLGMSQRRGAGLLFFFFLMLSIYFIFGCAGYSLLHVGFL